MAGGRLFTLPVASAEKPSLPIYVGALAEPAIRRAARLADGRVVSAGATLAEVRERVAFYRQALAEAGKGEADRLPLAINRVVHVSPSGPEKRRAEEFFARAFLSFYDRWGHADIVALSADERLHARTSREHFIFGEPAECVELIHEYAELGIGHIACLMNFGKPEPKAAERSLRLFGENVLPACSSL